MNNGVTHEVTKTYYWTNKLKNEFPPEFIGSKNSKWVVVE